MPIAGEYTRRPRWLMTTRGRRGPGEVSLCRALSKLGVASRAEAARLVCAGRVTVAGRPVSDPELPVVPERAEITVDGEPVRAADLLTVALHKPRGVVTTRHDPEGRRTVYAYLSAIAQYLGPVGRLDAATSGLLLLTNDTRLADWLTDPRNAVRRVYLATVEGKVDDDTAVRLIAGLEDGGERLAAAVATVRKRSRRESHLTLELTTGKKREIRRLLAGVGHPVTRLRRVAFGGLELGELAPGAYRRIPAAELAAAFPRAPLR